MKRQKVDGGLERQIISSMIYSTRFLSRVAAKIDTQLLESKPLVLIANWCIFHFKRHRRAPRQGISSVYNAWVNRDDPDAEEARAVGDLLAQAKRERHRINTEVLIDETAEMLNGRVAQRLADSVHRAISQGSPGAAEKIIADHRAISLTATSGISIFSDRDVWRRAFAEGATPLFKFGGDAGRFLNAQFTRDSLIAVQGVEKRGKSWWCIEFMFRALRHRCKVAMFQVGDLSESQIMRRLACRIAMMPLRDTGEIKYPMTIALDKDDDGQQRASVEYDARDPGMEIDDTIAWAAVKEFKRKLRLDDDCARVSVHPNSSINVSGIHSVLEAWRYERSFVPDVILIDYPDILAPENGRLEERHQVNETWQALRRLSQVWHACVIAPTQATRDSQDAHTQRMKHASEDKRKVAHVTALLGLNQTDAEKDQGVMRLNWVALREGSFSAQKCLWVAQCIPMGRALVRATL